MAKLLKSGENTWKVIDNDAVLVDRFSDIDGKLLDKSTNKRSPDHDGGMPVLGEVYINEGGVEFIPAMWKAKHTSDHLREIADLMDGLGKPAQGQRVYIGGVYIQ